MKFIFSIIALMAVCCIATSKIERHLFQKELENGVMRKASVNLTHAIHRGLVDYDDQTMNIDQGEGGTIVYQFNLRDEFGISDLVELPCYSVDKYGCFVGKGA